MNVNLFKMQPLVVAAMVFSLFLGCSDDSSSDTVVNPEYSEKVHVSIDKEKQVILMERSDYVEEACILYNGNFNWGTEAHEASIDTVAFYEILHDTLEIFFHSKNTSPRFYVGGSTESLFGDWVDTECGLYDEKIICPSAEEQKYSEIYGKSHLVISENNFAEKVAYTKNYFDYDDYMNSAYMSSLHNAIASGEGRTTVSSGAIFYPMDSLNIAYYDDLYGVKIIEKTKDNEKIQIDEKLFEINVVKAERDSLDYIVAIKVKSDDTECYYEEQQVNVNESTCKDLTIDDIRMYDESRDFNDSLYIRGTFVKQNKAEAFEKCLKELL